MATDLCTRRLTKELKALKKEPITSPKMTVAPNEANILEMHYVIEGSPKTPYEGGIYHGKLIFPKEYPLKPPSVMMLTPSGRFQPNRRLCLSMSDFHPESWNPMWSVSTILTGLYSFMIETAPTLGSIETTTIQKQRFARQSLEYNVRDQNFCKLFPEYVEEYKKQQAMRRNALGISDNNNNNTSTGVSHDSSAAVHLLGGGANGDRPGDMNMLYPTAAGIIAILSAIVFAIRCL